jgi:predicted ester cyclase
MPSIDTHMFFEDYVQALNEHDLARMDAFYSPSIRFQLYDTVQNFDELIGGIKGIYEGFPDWRWEVLEVLMDGNLMTARYADTGTQAGPFQGLEPTGRKVQALEFASYRIVDDRIGEMWSSLDGRDVIRQLS